MYITQSKDLSSLNHQGYTINLERDEVILEIGDNSLLYNVQIILDNGLGLTQVNGMVYYRQRWTCGIQYLFRSVQYMHAVAISKDLIIIKSSMVHSKLWKKTVVILEMGQQSTLQCAIMVLVWRRWIELSAKINLWHSVLV